MSDLFHNPPAVDGPQCVENRPAARRTDPDTSHLAATIAQSKHKDARVAGYVWEVLRDGKPRIDEEIADAVRANGHPLTDSRVRHGRKLLEDMKAIVHTGTTRKTKAQGNSREWHAAGYCVSTNE